MPVRYQRRATLCRAAGQAARGRLPVLAQRAGRPQGALPGFRGAAPAPRRAGAGGQGLEAHHHPPGRQGQRGAADQRGPPQQVICQDEMTESAGPEAFQERLWGMFPQVFPCALSLPQIDRVRYHLFPEVRVSAQPGQFGLFGAGEAELPSLIRVMDFQQEQLARSLGEGHRVIHGVAGSGKTMILGYRCAHLAKVSMKPILVLCFNRSLAARLRQVMAEKGLGEKVVVQHFHGRSKEMLADYNADAPPASRDVDAYLAALLERTMDAVERGLIPRAQYAAVMIDEGHDFEPDWFRLVVQMVDPSSNSLLVLYDDAQSIYRSRKKGLDFSF